MAGFAAIAFSVSYGANAASAGNIDGRWAATDHRRKPGNSVPAGYSGQWKSFDR